MYFLNIVGHHIIFIFNTKWPISCFICEVLPIFLKVWVKCDYFEAIYIEMHVYTSNLNIVTDHPSTCYYAVKKYP